MAQTVRVIVPMMTSQGLEAQNSPWILNAFDIMVFCKQRTQCKFTGKSHSTSLHMNAALAECQIGGFPPRAPHFF